MTTTQAVFAFAGLFAAICYGLYRYAFTLHSVPGSWMLGVSLLFAIATIFELGLGCGLLWQS
jgi:hypothetical protein